VSWLPTVVVPLMVGTAVLPGGESVTRVQAVAAVGALPWVSLAVTTARTYLCATPAVAA
jgi:hypothetical protein